MPGLDWDGAKRREATRGGGQSGAPNVWGKPASEKQLRYLASLAERAGVPAPTPTSSKVAGEEIKRLKKRLGIADSPPRKKRGPLPGKKRGRR